MKYNKGFAPILILVVVLGVLAVGGVAYFAGKSSAPKNEVNDNSNFPPVDQNYSTPTTNNNPSVTSNTNNNVTPPVIAKQSASITVLSPSGGERVPIGSSIVIKWNSVNISNRVFLTLNLPGDKQVISSYTNNEVTEPNNGSFTWKLPKTFNDMDSTPIDHDYIAYITIKDSINGNIIGQSKNFTITPSAVTSNWKTYTGTQYGFSLQYPTGTQISDVDISGGRNIIFTTSQGTVMVGVVTQAWNNGVLSSPPNCEDTASGADRTNTNINGVNFLTFSMSKEMSGMNSPTSATEYCAIRNGTAYKLITRVGYMQGSSNGLGLDKNPTLNQMLASFKLN